MITKLPIITINKKRFFFLAEFSPDRIQQSQGQEQHRTTHLHETKTKQSSSHVTEKRKKKLKKRNKNQRERKRTIFVGYREGGDSATEIGEEDLHCAIVELKDLCFLALIRH